MIPILVGGIIISCVILFLYLIGWSIGKSNPPYYMYTDSFMERVLLGVIIIIGFVAACAGFFSTFYLLYILGNLIINKTI